MTTLVSLAFSLIYLFHYGARIAATNFEGFDLLLILMGGLVLTLGMIVQGLHTQVLQRAQEQLGPRLGDLVLADRSLRWARLGPSLFVVISVAFSVESAFVHFVDQGWLFALWLPLLGGSIDLIRFQLKHMGKLAVPSTTIRRMGAWTNTPLAMEALGESALKSLSLSHPSLVKLALQELLKQHDNLLQETLQDKMDYHTLLYHQGNLYETLYSLFDDAILLGDERLCADLITFMGKAGLMTMAVDPSSASMAMISIGRMVGHEAVGNLPGLEMKTEVILTEVAKALIKDAAEKKQSFGEPLVHLLNHLEDLEKNRFRRNREIDLEILRAPFVEMKQLLESDLYANLPDSSLAMGEVERVLAELSQLELVLRRMNPEEDVEQTPPPPEE